MGLSVHSSAGSAPEGDTEALRVLVRTAESQAARSDTEWVLPRRWVGRPADLAALAFRALEFSGVRAANAPVGSAAALFDQVVSVRPAGGLLSAVVSVLLPTQTRLLEPGWDWATAEELPLVLGEWDQAAVDAARAKAREMLRDTDLALRLLPDQFSLTDLRRVYQAHWGMDVDASNFAKRATLGPAKGFLEPVEQEQGKRGRPATLYRRGATPAPRLAPP